MTAATIDHFFQRALEHDQAGRLGEAETLYRAILDLDPEHAGANAQLGSMALCASQPQAALPYLRRALEAEPGDDRHWQRYAEALCTAGHHESAEAILALAQARQAQPLPPDTIAPLGERQILYRLFQSKRFVETEAAVQAVLAHYPRDAFSWKLYGSLLSQTGRPQAALEALQTALSLNPEDHELHNTLGVVFKHLDRLDEARDAYHQALRRKPDYVEARFNLGNLLKHLGRMDEAESSYRRALEVDPNDDRVHANLGLLLMQTSRLDEAEAAYRTALRLNPGLIEAHNNLGNILERLGRLTEAEASFRQALAIDPGFVNALNNLANVLKSLDRFEEAETTYRQVLTLQPDKQNTYSNLVFAAAYASQRDPLWIRAQSEGWECAMLSEEERAAARSRRFSPAPRTGRPLRVGVLSADFGQHAVAYFLLSWMREINPRRVELHLYPTNVRHDSKVALFHALNAPWTPVQDLSDAEAADRIRTDRIDILIDTSGHTAGNRLGIIAHRAAPVQCHYIGYFATTGLSEMDYFLADDTLIPPALDGQFTEQVWRLNHPWMAYVPLEEAPEPRWRADAGETLWVGSFNNLTKVREECLVLWAGVLRALPEARLLLKDTRGKDPSTQERIWSVLRREGVDPQRVSFTDKVASWQEHMAHYEQLDIALDPIPMTGGSTAFDTLWMGVPLVTLAGDRLVGRQGAAALAGLGRPEWIARDAEDYVRIVVELARDVEGRRAIRATQREQMRRSPLCDGVGMARALEKGFEQMFDQWWAGQHPVDDPAPESKPPSRRDSKRSNQRAKKQQRITSSKQDARATTSAEQREAFVRLFQSKSFAEAEALALQLIERYPHDAFARKAHGSVLSKLARQDDALAALQQAGRLNPHDPEIQNALSVVLDDLERTEEALDACHRALALKPDYVQAHNNLGNLLKDLGRLPEAEQSYRQALALDPEFALAHLNLGAVLHTQGRFEDAANHCLTALALDPGFAEAHSNLLFYAAYAGDRDPLWMRRQSEGWERAMLSEAERAAARSRHFSPMPRAGRPLRVGVLSADFGQHAVAYFLLSWMRELDPRRVELHLYPTKARHDDKVELFRALDASWTPVLGLSDVEAAAQIRADAVDILIDTNGHTAGNRLGIIAQRAAPVQCHYIGYFATTGLSEMDYFLADDTLIPPALDGQFTEQVWRLNHPWMAYVPLEEAPEPRWRADAGETLWVGSFNKLTKVREDCLVLWARVLRALPQARLLLKDARGKDSDTQQRILRVLAREGVDSERVTFAGKVASWREHMAQYDRLDIALDPIPMTGGSTAFDALWMGVPLVSLAGDRLIGRQGAAALAGLGRPEWIARDAEDYVRIVVELARDVEGRRVIRATQRERMRNSPLCDGIGMARALEEAFEQLFDRWWDTHVQLVEPSHTSIHVPEAKQKTDTKKRKKSQKSATSIASRVTQPLPAAKQQELVRLFKDKRFREAEAPARRLTESYPRSAFAWKAYGSVLSKLSRPEEALHALQRARDCNPDDHEIYNTLSVTLSALERTEEAIEYCNRSIELNPNYALAHNNLGNLLKELRRFSDSEQSYRRALELDPGYALAHMNLGVVLQELGKISEAEEHCRRAIELDPDSAEAHGTLGNFFLNLGQFGEAENCYRQALSINPELPEAHRNLGATFHQCGRLTEAEGCYRRAIEIKPDFERAHANLGAALAELERLPESESSYLKALELKPNDQATRDSFLFEFAYSGYYSPEHVKRLAEDWERAMLSESERTAARSRRFDPAPRAGRPLRLGVLSADFGQHAVAYFLLSWMRELDPRRVELHLYPTKMRLDSKVELFRRLNVPWIPVQGLSDAEAAERIRTDRIDILLDTSGHTASNRLGIVAHRAAPVQCHYIGYFATTGLSEMDYFLADDTLIPPELESQFTEQVWRLNHPWMAYAPLDEAPEPRWRADAGEMLWVGSFNNLTKVREPCLMLWAGVLRALPEARLLLKDVRSKDRNIQERIRRMLEREGVDPERVSFTDKVASWREHMAQYERLDIALDPIPMTGGSTAFDTLWMGVPLVSLAGDRLIGRQGAAALAGLGRPEWIARDAEDYVRIVVELARDVEGRRAIRSTQREQMRQSPLCDGVGMARALEGAFEGMFDRWWRHRTADRPL